MVTQFRKYEEADYSAILSLINSLYEEDDYGESISEEKINKTISELSKKPETGSIYVFLSDHAIIGYSIVINYWSNEFGGNIAVIDEIYVIPSARNKGIASKFIEFIISGSGLSPRMLQLEVAPTNSKAMEYYKKRGFEFAKNRVMVKKISSQSS
jgi:ribosomal protein S18 acetylase RimI-like enzyme